MAETNKEHFANGFERRDKEHDKDPFIPDGKPGIPVCPLHDKRDILFTGITTSVDGILKITTQIRASQLDEIEFRGKIDKRISSVEKHIGFTAKVIIGLCMLQIAEITFFVIAFIR